MRIIKDFLPLADCDAGPLLRAFTDWECMVGVVIMTKMLNNPSFVCRP